MGLGVTHPREPAGSNPPVQCGRYDKSNRVPLLKERMLRSEEEDIRAG